MIYLNLTNGLEFLEQGPMNIKFVRIQSTKCEQKDWSFIIEDLDYQFLFDLALGKNITIIDYSARKENARAVYQGLEWIKYVLNRRWFDKITIPYVKEHNVSGYFNEMYNNLSKRSKKKLDYVKKFLIVNEINLEGICHNTKLDSNYEKYKEILREYYRSN